MNNNDNNEDEDYDENEGEDRGYYNEEIYERVRDDDSIFLIENIEELIERLKKTMYYSLSDERIAKDLIYYILQKTKLKIKVVDNITDNYQHISFEELKNG